MTVRRFREDDVNLRVVTYIALALFIPANAIGLIFFAPDWGTRAAYAFAIAATAVLLIVNRDLFTRNGKTGRPRS